MFGLVPFRSGAVGRRRDLWDIDSIFENFLNDSMFPALYANSGQMKVDVKENAEEFVVEADIPGANKDQINLEIDENKLTISVDRQEEKEDKNGNYIRKERRYSSITRSFAVDNIVPEKATAKFENGVLRITLPKRQQEPRQNRKIAIE